MGKIINTYEASAADGSTVTIYEVQADGGIEASPNQNRHGRQMQLSDGRALTMVGERKFKIAGTDEVFLLERPYSP